MYFRGRKISFYILEWRDDVLLDEVDAIELAMNSQRLSWKS